MSSIQKRPNGKWRARYRDRVGREHARHFARKVDAQRWLDEATTGLVTGLYVTPEAGRITFKRWFDEWSARQVWEQGTRETAEQIAATVTFADLPLASIRTADVELWVKSMREPRKGRPDGLAPSTITTRFNYLAMCFRGAVRDKRIPVDPSAGVKLPRRRRADKAMTIPTPEQMGALIDAADPDFRAFILVCAFAGLRLGEAAGLQLADVDFLRRTLDVRRQVQGNTVASSRVCPPKYGAERTVYVPPALVEALAAHVEQYGVRGDERWVFSREAHVHHRQTAGHMWRRARDAAGLEGFTLHDARHFYASGLIAAGCDVVTVQRALGHTSPTITLSTYAHLWPDAEDRTRAAATDLMTAVTKPRADSLRTVEA